MSDNDWRQYAACRDVPTSWWFPAAGDTFANGIAAMVCRGCDVRLSCLDDALAAEAADNLCFGIRAGYTAAERLVMLRHRPGVVAAATVERTPRRRVERINPLRRRRGRDRCDLIGQTPRSQLLGDPFVPADPTFVLTEIEDRPTHGRTRRGGRRARCRGRASRSC